MGGHAAGRVVDDGGVLVAVCGQRGRFVGADASSLVAIPADIEARDTADPAALLDLETLDRRGVEMLISPLLQNPMRNLHGGVTLALADLVATAALAATDGPTLTSASVHMTYLRPIPAGVG